MIRALALCLALTGPVAASEPPRILKRDRDVAALTLTLTAAFGCRLEVDEAGAARAYRQAWRGRVGARHATNWISGLKRKSRRDAGAIAFCHSAKPALQQRGLLKEPN